MVHLSLPRRSSASNKVTFLAKTLSRCRTPSRYSCVRASVAVVLQSFEVTVSAQPVSRGNVAVLRCGVPSLVREFVAVTSWLQDQSFNIYPSNDGGEYSGGYGVSAIPPGRCAAAARGRG